jgi:peptidoglycan hydrolase-like protein with peptidoglycan-binding domain
MTLTAARPALARLRPGLALAAAGAGLLATATPAAAAPVLGSWLHLGSRGRTVSEAQRALHLRATGRFDRATVRAVRAFQSRKHLIVDGVVGPQTWDTLFHIQPAPASTTATTSYATPGTATSSGYTIPSAIVQCESGGNYSAVNPSSGAGGAYQILPSTWQAYGGQGLPQDAPPAEQDRIAAEIYAAQGPSAWSC